MKKFILTFFAMTALVCITGCRTPVTRTSTTTTEETTVHRPVGATSTTETHTSSY
ncbi:MAG: hypothetical protein ABI254_01475 [Chthoniobacterales bacterium]